MPRGIRHTFLLFVIFSSSTVWAETSSRMTLSLRDALKIAEKEQIDILISRTRVQQTLARQQAAGAPLLPQLSATASQFRQTRNLEAQGIRLPGDPLVGPFNSFDARLRLSQTLFDAASYQRWKLAELGTRLSEAEERKTRADTLAVIARLYLEARRASERQVRMSALLKKEELRRTLAQTQRNLGTSSTLEWQEAETTLQSTRAQEGSASIESDNRRRELLTALGLPLETLLDYPADSLQTPEAFQAMVSSSASIPDREVAQASLALRKTEEALSRVDHYPRLSASADYGLSGKTPSDTKNTYTYGAQLALPLFEGGSKIKKQAETRFLREEAELRQIDVDRRIENRERNSADQLQQLWNMLRSQKAQLEQAEREQTLTDSRRRIGMSTELEQTEHLARVAIVRDAYLESSAAYQLAQLEWAHAVGALTQWIQTENHP